MVAPLAGVAAYQATAKLGGTAQAGAAGSSFGDFLSGAMKDAIGSMKQGEQAAVQQAAGKGDIVSVVNAVNQAELTLDTVVAVRDKVIQAYQSIMQMPI
ncbi:MAG TPA: flagellar hook-basal body complex protein FliE [Rhizomicrobium sp.]|nr:flagellar hook-basal body complex protein FliE [Rhizomicrobium sp.]